MRPLKDVVMCKYVPPESLETQTNSGIIITSKEQDLKKPVETEVIEVGAEVKEIKKGDRIVFTRQYNVDKEINGEMYTFLREGDILVVL